MPKLPFKNRNDKRKEQDFEARLAELDEKQKQIELENKVIKREKELGLRRTWKKPTWSKLMMAVIFGVCVEIVIYAEWVMFVRYDLSALYTLLGIPVAMFGTYFAYCEKAKQENTANGITYELAMKEAEVQNMKINLEPPDAECVDSEPIDAEDGSEGVG